MKLRHWWPYPAVLIGCSACAGQLPPDHPCSERSEAYRARIAACIARVQLECPDVPDEQCPAVEECDRYFEETCR